MDEFELIRRCFAPLASSPGADGLRDDVAEIETTGRVIVTADTLVEGVHFLKADPIASLAAKLVRVNVSDIIAKGAAPAGALLMLTWPKDRPLAAAESFARRLGEELDLWGAHLLGGDTTSTAGPLTLSMTLLGECSSRGPVRRSGANPGEDLWVTGVIGDGWLGLKAALGELSVSDARDIAALIDAYRIPQPPPLKFAALIAAHASAAIDVSDGLVADAGHLAAASKAELIIDWMDVPLGEAARRWLKSSAPDAEIGALLTGGDDYQTLFTAPPAARAAIREESAAIGVRMTRIGRVEAGEGVSLIDASGSVLILKETGWRHFREPPPQSA